MTKKYTIYRDGIELKITSADAKFLDGLAIKAMMSAEEYFKDEQPMRIELSEGMARIAGVVARDYREAGIKADADECLQTAVQLIKEIADMPVDELNKLFDEAYDEFIKRRQEYEN